MMTSFFSNDFRNILLTSIDKYELSNKGYETYNYLEDNIRSFVNHKFKNDKDNYRLVKIGIINTMTEEVNIWFVGYHDWNKIDSYKKYNFYIGKSICISELKNKDTQNIDKLNLLFNGCEINDFQEDNLIDSIYNYWNLFMQYLFEETDLKNLTTKFNNCYMYGIYIENYLTYINLVSAYHLYKIINSYSSDSLCKSIKEKISENDIINKFNKIKGPSITKEELRNFVEKVDLYK